MASSSSSSYCKWSYDVFPSFRGEDVRTTFLSHFLKELDRRSIVTFKDNGIERSRSLEPELKQAIRDSRISVVVFSRHYASSSWCLNELVEIVKCKEDLGQLVIPVFYGLDPSHVRKQTGEFGEAFDKTCCNKTVDVIQLWRKSLTDVSNIAGYYHSWNCGNEATMIEAIANDVLGKLILTPSKDFENYVGIEDHMAKMSLLLRLESDEVIMLGIWGSSGIGKTTIARALFNRLSRTFQSSIFIDRAFVSKSMEIFSIANADDYNMKLHLQKTFLSEILGQKDVKLDHLGVVEERLKHMKVLVVFDDLDDQVVLEALAGQRQWFGCGSRIIVVTKDKHILRSHGIAHVYQVGLPSEKLALQMFCQSAFRQNYPPDGFMEIASEVALRAGKLPLGLNVLGSSLRGRDKEEWVDMLPRLQNGLDGKIEKTLRVSYYGLNNKKDEAIFRHIACLFNGEKVEDIKELLADSDLDVNIGLKNLVDKSLVQIRDDIVEMHRLLQEMGREIVRAQSNEPGEREFLVNPEDILRVLGDNAGTTKVIGIALEIDEINELHVHKRAFHGMPNLCFLKIYTKLRMSPERHFRCHLPKGFNYLPPKLRLLFWDRYPLSVMPFKFRPENLIKLRMRKSKLKKLGKRVRLLACKDMDFSGSEKLKKMTILVMATNLETLNLSVCSSMKELTRSWIENLNNLVTLDMAGCTKLKDFPNGLNLQSLNRLNLHGCSRLKIFPDISRNISELFLGETSIRKIPSNLHLDKLVDLRMLELKTTKLWKRVEPLKTLMAMVSPSLTRLLLSDIPTLVEFPSSFQFFYNLMHLRITECENLEILPVGINLKSLSELNISSCSRLKTFPDISTNIQKLVLYRTGIEEVPCWIDKFSNLDNLFMPNCDKLKSVSLNIYKARHLTKVDSEALTEENSFHDRVPVVVLNFINCFNLDQEALLQQQSIIKQIILPGVQVPSYFTHRTNGNSLTNIPLLETQDSFPSQPFFRFRACAVFEETMPPKSCVIDIQVSCRFGSRLGNHFDSTDQSCSFCTYQKGRHMVIFDCFFPLHDENSPHLAQLNYDHVDIQFHLTDDLSKFTLKGCGIRLPHDSTPYPDSRASTSNTVEDIREADESNVGGNETEERENKDLETDRRRKRTTVCLARLACGWKSCPPRAIKRKRE